MGLAAVVAATLCSPWITLTKCSRKWRRCRLRGYSDCLCHWCGDRFDQRPDFAYLNVTPFITTLGTMIIVYALTRSITTLSGRRQFLVLTVLLYLCSGLCRAGEFPSLLHPFYALIAVVFVWVLWNKTRFARTFLPLAVTRKRRKYLVSTRPEPADDLRVVWCVLCLRRVLEAGRIGSATNNLGFMYELMLSQRAWWAAYRSAAV